MIDTRIKGHSYPQDWYEDAVRELLGKIGDLDDQAMTEIVRLHSEGLAKPDDLTRHASSGSGRERRSGWRRRVISPPGRRRWPDWTAEQQVARQPRQQRMAPDEVVAYLRSLPSLWSDAAPEGRQALAAALFTKLDVEGYTKTRYQLTPDAVTSVSAQPCRRSSRPVVTQVGLVGAVPADRMCGRGAGGVLVGQRSVDQGRDVRLPTLAELSEGIVSAPTEQPGPP
jgi:hypothetical protein